MSSNVSNANLLCRLGLLLTAVMACTGQAAASTPSSGMVTEAAPTISYTVPGFTSVNSGPVPEVDTGPRCGTGFPCDTFKLTTDISPAFIAANPYATVRVTLTWDNPVGDYGLDIFEGQTISADGTHGASYGSETYNNPEVGYIDPVAGKAVFSVNVIPYIATVADTISVKVELLANPPDPCVAGAVYHGNKTGADSMAKYLAVPGGNDLMGGFMHFAAGGSKAEQDALLKKAGVLIGGDYRQYANSVYVQGTQAAFRLLLSSQLVAGVEQNKPLRYFGGSGTWASRVRVAQEPAAGGPYYDAKGNRLTGKGVTLCVVDSGLDAPHPDFAGRVLHNYKVAGSGPAAGQNPMLPIVDMGANGDTGTTGGHGTHCAGIAAGSGASSIGEYVAGSKPNDAGTYTGSAPEASIVAYGSGETLVIFTATQAFQHILDNYKADDPQRIRVISNSYGATGPYGPNDTYSCLTRALVKKNISVVFAAGNSAGDGTEYTTSPTCKDPTPGVICVASYDDGQTGALNNPLSDFSSRGTKGRPYTYPDIAAPGSNITSTCLQPQPGQGVCATGAETMWQPYYGTISGTSMATPHVAGAIALLYQAKPDLTPVEVERLLQNTARKVGTNGAYEPDPQNPGGTTNFGFGAGLLDLPAALNSLGIKHGSPNTGSMGPVMGAEYTIFDGDADPTVTSGAGDVTKLTMQEQMASPSGIVYRLTLASTTVGMGYTYSVEQDVDGVHKVTQVALNAMGASAVAGSALNTSPATNVKLTGNVLSFFVPYALLGSPAVNAPIHDIRVVVADSMGNDADYAPSPANVPAAIAATEPSYGRPFTVTVPTLGGPVAPIETTCVLPGITLFTDAPGDSLTMMDQDDMQQAWVAQPASADTTKLTIKIKVASLSGVGVPMANRTWFVSFMAPDQMVHGMRMSTLNTGGAITYESYLVGANTAGAKDGRFTTAGSVKALAAGSGFDAATGIITLVANVTDIGAAKAGDELNMFNAGITLPATVNGSGITEVVDEMPDGLGRVGSYMLRGASFCAVNTAPLAKLLADKTTGAAPLEVNFTGAGSSDPDAGDTIASYSFDFGDGSPKLTQGAPTATHRFTQEGSYTATMSVTDSRQKASAMAASVPITVTKAGSSTPPPSTTPPPTNIAPATPVASTATSSAGEGRFGGAFGFIGLLPLLSSALRRRRRFR